MIIVALRSRVLGVSFKHRRRHPDLKEIPTDGTVRPFWAHDTTFCTIYEITGTNATTLCEADATCHESDNFCKATGRKLALGRALDILYPYETGKDGKQERSMVWDAYLNRGIVKQTIPQPTTFNEDAAS